MRCLAAPVGESESQPASLQPGHDGAVNRPIPPARSRSRRYLANFEDCFALGPARCDLTVVGSLLGFIKSTMYRLQGMVHARKADARAGTVEAVSLEQLGDAGVARGVAVWQTNFRTAPGGVTMQKVMPVEL